MPRVFTILFVLSLTACTGQRPAQVPQVPGSETESPRSSETENSQLDESRPDPSRPIELGFDGGYRDVAIQTERGVTPADLEAADAGTADAFGSDAGAGIISSRDAASPDQHQ